MIRASALTVLNQLKQETIMEIYNAIFDR